MTEISRTALFGKLNQVCYRGIEAATVFCKLRGNPYVEMVHWLHQLLQLQDSDLHRIIRHAEIDPGRLAAELIVDGERVEEFGQVAVGEFDIHDRADDLDDFTDVGDLGSSGDHKCEE